MDLTAQHSIHLESRENLSITGVTDVDEFNEQVILVICESDELTIKGELLHIEELSLDTGNLIVSGKINSLSYSEKVSGNSIIKRLFGG